MYKMGLGSYTWFNLIWYYTCGCPRT